MSVLTCRDVMRSLGAYVDDELPGVARLAISSHLGQCGNCSAERIALGELGESLRLESAYRPAPDDVLAGLAGSVTSRIGAEQSQSWRTFWRTAFEDTHWVAVGVGSIMGALVSFVLASAMLSASIAQVMRMNARAGTLFVIALPDGGRGGPVLMEYEQSLGAAKSDARLAMPASFGWEAERALVSALDATLVRSGRPTSLQGLSTADREDILALLSEISEIRYQEPTRRPHGLTSVSGMHLLVTTSVTAIIP